MKLNSTIKIRISSEMKNQLKEISQKLGFRETDLTRYLLNRSLQQLKNDISTYGQENITFTLKRGHK